MTGADLLAPMARDEATAAQALGARHQTMRLANRLSIAANAEDPQDAELLSDAAAASVMKTLGWIISDNCESAGALAYWLDSRRHPGDSDLAEALRAIGENLKPIAHGVARIYREMVGLPYPVGYDQAEQGGEQR